MSEENKAIIRRYFEYAGQGNWDKLGELVADGHVYHYNPAFSGAEGQQRLGSSFLTAFPDLRITVEAQIAEGDTVVSRLTGQGTHTGDLMGIPPTGKQATIPFISIMRLADGKVTDEWEIVDEAGLLRQLGLLPDG
jgi:steroid delta-isomerase-like uncharacterized protein